MNGPYHILHKIDDGFDFARGGTTHITTTSMCTYRASQLLASYGCVYFVSTPIPDTAETPNVATTSRRRRRSKKFPRYQFLMNLVDGYKVDMAIYL